MKWTRAVHHLEELANKCAELADAPASIYRLRVVRLWAVGEILGPVRDLDRVTVALAVDLPPEEVPWLAEPAGAEHWSHATRMATNPITPLWRSAHSPVWNHSIHRPALLWDTTSGVAEQTLTAIRRGDSDHVRLPAPTPDDLRARLETELALTLRSLRQHTDTYSQRRWTPGKLTPFADALWRASAGYLDLLDALDRA